MRPRNSRHGSTLVIALITVLVIAMVTGHILLRITGQLDTAHRSVAWNEALTTAESAVDMTIADLTAILPDVRLNSGEGLVVGVSQLPPTIVSALAVQSTKLGLQPGVTLSYSPAPLRHGGEGAGRQEATVFIDVLNLSQLLGSGGLQLSNPGGLLSNPLGAINGGDLQLVRVRARGTVAIPSRRSDRNALDAELRRATLVWDRTSGQRAGKATISREVEVMLKPVFPYQSAVTTGGLFKSPSSNAVFDSYNSLLATASTDSRYDLTKRLLNGDINVNDSQVTLGGRVYGDVRTSNSSITKTDRITGVVESTYQEPLPLVRTPTWQRPPLTPTEVTHTTNVYAGTMLAPARYKFDRVTGALRIRNIPGNVAGGEIEIWVTGDITGSITLDEGVRAKIYVEGNVTMNSNDLVNRSEVPSNLMIFGLPDSNSSNRKSINLKLGDVSAAIYAPTHDVKLTGDGHFQGSITCANFVTEGDVQVHFDESLALNTGPILRFQVASWTERLL